VRIPNIGQEHERTVGRREKKFGADHPHALASKHNLARLYHDQGKYDRAESLLLEILQHKEKRLGIDHPSTLASKNNLAMLLSAQRKYDQAEPLFQQVVTGAIKTLGLAHPNTQGFIHNLTDLYERWGKPEKAEPLLRQQLDFLRGNTGTQSPTTAGAMTGLGSNLLLQKKYAEGERLLRDCLRIREKTQPDHWTTCNTRSMLGAALLGQKQYAEAGPLLLEGYRGLKQREAKIPPPVRALRLKEALQRLVELAEATGKKDAAAKWQQKLDEIKKAAASQAPKK
jgi:eukaryotic-like serine/threonine-protein kinase